MKIDLDEALTTTECAKWLKLDTRNLLAKVREGKIPVIKLNERVFRFHPRSVLIALRQEGVQPEQLTIMRNLRRNGFDASPRNGNEKE